VWGDDDTAAPLAGAERARDLIGANADLTVCPGAGHLVPVTAPDALRTVVERALA
jgi:pimeloyl-ACP methyl ester carboxylesterase